MGIPQGDLARSASVSRQALLAIEANRAVPSVAVAMRIARALGATVDALFGEEEAALRVLVAGHGRVAMAWIGDRWVAHGLGEREHDVAADAIADGRRATFLRDPTSVRENVIVAGCAPALGPLCDRLNGERGVRYVWLARSSTDAVRDLRGERVHVAGIHGGVIGVPRCELVTLASWEVGLVVAKGNPLRIRSAACVGRRGVRLVTREKGSGARRMLERALSKEGANAKMAASKIVATGHREVARCIAMGAADVGPGVADVARSSGLDFVPLGFERFDLALSPNAKDDPRIARLLDALSSEPARREMRALGYDVEQSGKRVA
jgi:molybdate-binding protein/DNA-binding XRE family transcriptional regulator